MASSMARVSSFVPSHRNIGGRMMQDGQQKAHNQRVQNSTTLVDRSLPRSVRQIPPALRGRSSFDNTSGGVGQAHSNSAIRRPSSAMSRGSSSNTRPSSAIDVSPSASRSQRPHDQAASSSRDGSSPLSSGSGLHSVPWDSSFASSAPPSTRSRRVKTQSGSRPSSAASSRAVDGGLGSSSNYHARGKRGKSGRESVTSSGDGREYSKRGSKLHSNAYSTEEVIQELNSEEKLIFHDFAALLSLLDKNSRKNLCQAAMTMAEQSEILVQFDGMLVEGAMPDTLSQGNAAVPLQTLG